MKASNYESIRMTPSTGHPSVKALLHKAQINLTLEKSYCSRSGKGLNSATRGCAVSRRRSHRTGAGRSRLTTPLLCPTLYTYGTQENILTPRMNSTKTARAKARDLPHLRRGGAPVVLIPFVELSGNDYLSPAFSARLAITLVSVASSE